MVQDVVSKCARSAAELEDFNVQEMNTDITDDCSAVEQRS
jgi:hypothetical protein